MFARMTDEEVKTVVSAVLGEAVRDAGFRDVAVSSDVDRDGEPILRINARYDRRPPGKPDALISAIHAVRSALTERGEDRSIILTNEVDSERQNEALAEEDAD